MIERLAHYRIRRKLGEGAMGVIYEGVDDNLRMPVAIKVLNAAVAADEENLHRFEREAQAAANLKHPNIAHVFYIGRTDDKLPFYAMEYIDGISLDTVIKKRMHTTGRQMLSIMQQTVKALGFAASREVIHRDIKPGNIMIAADGTVKLVDFGLVKPKERDTSLTQTGIALGTPNYLSPELAQGLPGDFHADMYSAGVTFFELLTGVLPFPGETAMAVLVRQINDPVPDIRAMNPQYPRRLTSVIQRMMAKKPEERYASYDDISLDLQRVLAEEGAFLAAFWSLCPTCHVNVQVVGSNRCTVCNQEIAPSPKTEATYTVRLTGFSDSQALARVTDYMRTRLQKSPEQIRKMLEHIPLVLGTRVPHKQASMLKMKLYELGGLVDLEPCGIRQEGREPEVKVLDIQPLENAHNLPVRSAEIPAPPPARNWPFVLASLALLISIMFLAWRISREPVSDASPEPPPQAAPIAEPAQAAPSPDASPPENAPTERPSPAQTLSVISPFEYVTLHTSAFGDAESIALLAAELESDLSRLQMEVGSLPTRRVTFILNGHAKPPAEDMHGLSSRHEPNRVEIAVAGMDPASPDLRRVIRVQIGRTVARHLAGERTPLWVETGLGAFVEGYLAGRTPAPHPAFITPPWDEARLRRDLAAYTPDTLTQLGDFTAFLIERYSFRQLASWLESLRDNPEERARFEAVFGQSREAVWENWRAWAGPP